MEKSTFWATKSPLAEFHAVTFTHPVIEPFRLVANQFAPVTLSGLVHTPAPMTIKPPDQKSDAQSRMTMAFPRQVVGREFKRELARVVESGSREPIRVTYSVYLGVTDAPQLTWEMYVADAAGIQFNAESVQVTATDSNPMRQGVGVIYDPAAFTGLELI